MRPRKQEGDSSTLGGGQKNCAENRGKPPLRGLHTWPWLGLGDTHLAWSPPSGGGGFGLGLIDWVVRNLTIPRYPSQPEGRSTPPSPRKASLFTLYLQSWEVKSLTNPHKRGAANNFRMKLLHFQSSGTLSLSRGIGWKQNSHPVQDANLDMVANGHTPAQRPDKHRYSMSLH